MIAVVPVLHGANGPRMMANANQNGIKPGFSLGLDEKIIRNPQHQPMPVLLNQFVLAALFRIEFEKPGTAALKVGGNYIGKWRAVLECWSTPIGKRFPIDITCDVLIKPLRANQLETLSLFANLAYQIRSVVTLGRLGDPFLK